MADAGAGAGLVPGAGVPTPRGPANGWLQMLVTLNMFNVCVMGGGKLQT